MPKFLALTAGTFCAAIRPFPVDRENQWNGDKPTVLMLGRIWLILELTAAGGREISGWDL